MDRAINVNGVILAQGSYTPPTGYVSKGLVVRDGETFMVFAPLDMSRERAVQLLGMRRAEATYDLLTGTSKISVNAIEGDVVGDRKVGVGGEKVVVSESQKLDESNVLVPPNRVVSFTGASGRAEKVDTSQVLGEGVSFGYKRQYGYGDYGSIVNEEVSRAEPPIEKSMGEIEVETGFTSGKPELTDFAVVGAGRVASNLFRSFNYSTGEVIPNEKAGKVAMGVTAGVVNWVNTNPFIMAFRQENVGAGFQVLFEPVKSSTTKYSYVEDVTFKRAFNLGRFVAPTLASMIVGEQFFLGAEQMSAEFKALDEANALRIQANTELEVSAVEVKDGGVNTNWGKSGGLVGVKTGGAGSGGAGFMTQEFIDLTQVRDVGVGVIVSTGVVTSFDDLVGEGVVDVNKEESGYKNPVVSLPSFYTGNNNLVVKLPSVNRKSSEVVKLPSIANLPSFNYPSVNANLNVNRSVNVKENVSKLANEFVNVSDFVNVRAEFNALKLPPLISPMIKLPSGGGGFSLRGFLRGLKPRGGYTPSVFALSTGFKSSKPPRVKVFSGAGLRPVIVSKKKVKKRRGWFW